MSTILNKVYFHIFEQSGYTTNEGSTVFKLINLTTFIENNGFQENY